MSLPLIQTKFYIPPIRSSHIVRPRLRETLNHDLTQEGVFNRKLTLICAPAGYGKTSLTIDWLNSLKLPVAWLSLDERDNDPIRFLTYLVNAFRQVFPEVGRPSLEMLQAPQLPAPEELLVPLFNEIAAIGKPVLFVMDDYHLIHTASIHQFLNFLVDYQSQQMHTTIVSREDPPLPLHRLRARGQMTEVRQDTIRFTLEETDDFLTTVTGKALTPENIKDVEHRTEGWVTGMQLLALSLQTHPDANEFIRSFTGSNRFVLDYLFEEVFKRQNQDIQDFLLKTAVLENLSAGLCEAVTGHADSGKILAMLDQSNLFVRQLDQSETWFRYHRLFLDLLKHRLRLHDTIDQDYLHRKASQWYQENGFLEEAVSHSLAGCDWANALDLIYQVSGQLLKTGAVATLLGWHQQIPTESILSKPEYCFTYAWPLMLSGQLQAAEMYLETAENLAPERSVLMGEVAAAQAFLARTMGNEQRLVRYSEQALALIPKTDLSARSIVAMNLGIAYWHNGDMEKTEQTLSEILSGTQQSGNKYAELTSLFFLGRVHAVRGHLRQAIDIFKNIVALKVRMPIIGLVYLDLSALHYELNDLEACEKYLELGEDLIGTKEHLEFQIAGMMQKARLMVAKGDYPGALSILESCSQISNSADIPLRTQHRIASCIVELAIACEDVEQALAWSAKASEGADAHPFYRFLSLSTVRLLMAKGEKSEALERINEWIQTAEVAGWDYGMVHLGLLKALASPDMDSAIHPMTGALSTGQPEGFIRTFIDLGSDLVPILREAARRGVQPEYVGKILAAYGEQPGQTALPPEIEPLSDREMEVLRLLAAGLTNKQIADQLFVSISTVKSHVHHISSKLDVSNRTQAVARARQLNLL